MQLQDGGIGGGSSTVVLTIVHSISLPCNVDHVKVPYAPIIVWKLKYLLLFIVSYNP